jgi:hypothetical protein
MIGYGPVQHNIVIGYGPVQRSIMIGYGPVHYSIAIDYGPLQHSIVIGYGPNELGFDSWEENINTGCWAYPPSCSVGTMSFSPGVKQPGW